MILNANFRQYRQFMDPSLSDNFILFFEEDSDYIQILDISKEIRWKFDGPVPSHMIWRSILSKFLQRQTFQEIQNKNQL